jgi:hypothetical protein
LGDGVAGLLPVSSCETHSSHRIKHKLQTGRLSPIMRSTGRSSPGCWRPSAKIWQICHYDAEMVTDILDIFIKTVFGSLTCSLHDQKDGVFEYYDVGKPSTNVMSRFPSQDMFNGTRRKRSEAPKRPKVITIVQ